jgi:hypothetical protein
MKNTIQIIHVVPLSGRSKKTGNDYDMRMAQCIVQKIDRETGLVTPLIGELVLPERFKDTTPGTYEVEFEVAIDNAKRIGAQVASITPVVAGRAAAPIAPAAAGTAGKAAA